MWIQEEKCYKNTLKSKWLFLNIEIVFLVAFLEFNFFLVLQWMFTKYKMKFDKQMQDCILRENCIGGICVQNMSHFYK